jgi:predicted MFS family arabinose efflux permease
MSQIQPAATVPVSPAYRRYVLTALVVVYAFNFIDRQILGILAVPIKAELHLSDTRLGMMGGIAFALFYTFLGIPVARLADRSSRTWIMTIALGLWSALTAACGMAQNFTQLFLLRLGVGVGEAGGVAPAYSLICDYYPPAERARALSLYSFGIPIGSALGLVAGGVLSTLINWRAAFFLVGAAGLVLVPIFRLTVREPARGLFDGAPANDTKPTLLAVGAVLFRKPSFWALALGAASSSMMGYAAFFWFPSFFHRSFGLSVYNASVDFGAIYLAGGLTGMWLGGVLADRFGASHKGAYAAVPAVAFACVLPFFVVALLSTSLPLTLGVLIVPVALSLAWLGPVLAAVQHLVPATMRTTASAIFLFINNLIGIGIGTFAIGALSDAMQYRFGAESLRYAILAGSGFYLVAAAFLLFAARRLERDWER